MPPKRTKTKAEKEDDDYRPDHSIPQHVVPALGNNRNNEGRAAANAAKASMKDIVAKEKRKSIDLTGDDDADLQTNASSSYGMFPGLAASPKGDASFEEAASTKFSPKRVAGKGGKGAKKKVTPEKLVHQRVANLKQSKSLNPRAKMPIQA
jgi:hypothetical protein